MWVTYPVILTVTNDAKDTYLIEIPDLKGATVGYGINNAIRMAKNYIYCRLYDIVFYGKSELLPAPTPIGEIDTENGEFGQEGKNLVLSVRVHIEDGPEAANE